MSKSTLYDWSPSSLTTITDELYASVGSSTFQLGNTKRAFKGGADVVIRTAAGGGGTLLSETTDYTLENADSTYTGKAGFTVYSGIKIVNAAYQAVNLYISYKCVGSYVQVASIPFGREWVTSTGYLVGDMILKGSTLYICQTAHTSGTFTTDWITNGYWIATGEAPGSIKPWPSATAPTGWVQCDGSLKSKTTYPELYVILGTTWGAGDASNFTLPDLRGMFLRGTGSHGTLNMANGNDFAGPAVGASENDQLQGHKHGVSPDPVGYGFNDGSTSVARTGDANTGSILVTGPITDGVNGDPRSGDETRPVNYGVQYIIKLT